jgi:hypothetical protein
MNIRISIILCSLLLVACEPPRDMRSRGRKSFDKMELRCWQENKIVGCVFVSDGPKPHELSCICVADEDRNR